MHIERGTAQSDVPHRFEPDVDPNEKYMAGSGPDSHVCHVCGQKAGAAIHTRWRSMNAASRESAAQIVPRIHG